jgi:hypothetical protein
MSSETSRLRQRLAEVGKQYQSQLEILLRERGPVIRGTFGTRRRVCGRPNCRCTEGQLHESKYLTASDRGRVRQVHVPAADEVRVAEGVKRYRRFGQARARLAELVKVQLTLIDQIGLTLRVPYPADKPLPAPMRRGRTPKGDGDRTR